MPRPEINQPVEQLIDGELVKGEGAMLDIEDPATGELFATVPMASADQLDRAVASAAAAVWSEPWRGISGAARSDMLAKLATLVDANATELANLIVAETGAPIAATTAFHVRGAADYFRWYADAAKRERTRQLEPRDGATPSGGFVQVVPIGVVAAITAYNYPLLLAANKLGAALAAGCSIVLMPSPQAPLATLKLGHLLGEAGFPRGSVQIIVGDAEIGRRLTEHPSVDKVSFTGSTNVGEQIARQAGGCGKGAVLELGGKAPCILMPDADLAAIVRPLMLRLFRNAGQGCQVPSRILVHDDQLQEFVDRARESVEQISVGDPWDPKTVVGPVISEAHRLRIEGIVARAVSEGGQIVAQGDTPQGAGHWVAPALLSGVSNQSEIAREEIFGPVGVVLSYQDLDQAVAIANDTSYGLAAHVYGPSTTACMAIADRLYAGSVHINGVGLRPDAPSGGFKRSGVGREQGEEGIREFLTTKTISWAL